MSADRIVIVGGGVVGSSIAWHLRAGGFEGGVTVVERDPTYRRASSFLAMGGVRQQFGSAANIRFAQHSVRFYERFDTAMQTPEHRPRAWFRQRGYLFLANDENAERLERRYARGSARSGRASSGSTSTPFAPAYPIWPSTTSASASSGRTTATRIRARCWPASGTRPPRPGRPMSPAKSPASGWRADASAA